MLYMWYMLYFIYIYIYICIYIYIYTQNPNINAQRYKIIMHRLRNQSCCFVQVALLGLKLRLNGSFRWVDMGIWWDFAVGVRKLHFMVETLRHYNVCLKYVFEILKKNNHLIHI